MSSREPEKPPPNDLEAELSALACVLDCDQTQAAQYFRQLEEHHFYSEQSLEIFRTLTQVEADNAPFSVVELNERLNANGRLERIGGVDAITALRVPSAANFPSYLEILKDRAARRETISAAQEAIRRANDMSIDAVGARKQNGKFYTVDHLDRFEPKSDANNRIGNRWLCRSGKLLIPAASGVGKSSLAMQMQMLFALGKDFCGIKPARPLSSLTVGDENDEGDLSEMFQGTRDFLKINSLENQAEYNQLRGNLKFWHCPALSGPEFLRAIEDELTQNPRDICCLDPLVSFAGVDLTKQDKAAQFLRSGLSRIAERTGVIWFIIHHTPKPYRDQNSGKRKISEFQYAGAGSFDLPGWARAVMTLEEATDGVFRLILSKRGPRAGATHPNGEPTRELWLKHAEKSIHWEQLEPPKEPEPSARGKGGKPSKVDQIMQMGLGPVIDTLTEPLGKNKLAEKIASFAVPRMGEVGLSTCKLVVDRLMENNAIKCSDKGYQKA